MELSAVEVRVLGCLVEKQLTTPQQYPLTLNALLLACNQTSNRDPVADYGEPAVEGAVTSVKTMGLVSFVHPSHGRSALRYRHMLEEAWGTGRRPLALLGVLMLRGPQTPGELRARADRMVPFADTAEVEAELDALSARTEPLVARLRRAPGQKEDRYTHLVGGAVSPDARTSDSQDDHGADGGDAPGPTIPAEPRPTAPPAPGLSQLQAEVYALRAQVTDLRAAVDELHRRLGTENAD
jgi:hypothetical protein